MSNILQALTASPLLAIIGLAVIVAIVFAPAALSLAGLTGAQILELLASTMTFILNVIREMRNGNKPSP